MRLCRHVKDVIQSVAAREGRDPERGRHVKGVILGGGSIGRPEFVRKCRVSPSIFIPSDGP